MLDLETFVLYVEEAMKKTVKKESEKAIELPGGGKIEIKEEVKPEKKVRKRPVRKPV